MTEPTTPMPTQTRHPWRATLRTGLAVVAAIASLLPYVLAGVDIGAVPAVGQVLAVATGITRAMADPKINALLTSIGLGATPSAPPQQN